MPEEKTKKHEEAKRRGSRLNPKQRKLGIAIFVAVIIGALLPQALSPKRSVEAYCKTLKEENTRLATKSGDTYATSVFSEQSSDPHDFVISLSRLEEVAPNDIRSDVKTLRQTFEKIEKDPSQLLAAGIGGLSAEDNIENWNKTHCELPDK